MSIATLKEELLREIAAAALGEEGARFLPIGAGTDLIHWRTEPRELVFLTRGPALIVAHVRDGVRVWMATGVHARACGIASIVATNTVLWVDDRVGVSRLCVRRDPTRPAGPFDAEHIPLFGEPAHVAAFCSNVLEGHIQDADAPR